MDQYTFPHSNINTVDGSGATIVNITVDPLHIPVFWGFAPKGEIGKPVYGSGTILSQTFSTDIFQSSTALGGCHQMQYFQKAASLQRCYFIRLPDGSQTLGFSVIVVAKSGSYPAYAKDATTNAFQTTTTGGVTSYTVTNDASGSPATATATAYSVVTTPLLLSATTGNYEPDDATIRATFNLEKADSWYEIIRVTGKTPGNWTARSAFSLAVTPSSVAEDITARINMPLVRFSPLFASDINFDFLAQTTGEKSYTYSPQQSFFGQSYTDIVLNARSVIDPTTTQDLGWEQALSAAYSAANTTPVLDYDIFVNTDGGLAATGPVSTGIQGVLALAMRMGLESGQYTNGQMAPNWSDATAVRRFLAAVQKINVLTGQDITGKNLLNVPLDTNNITGAQPFGSYSMYNGFSATDVSTTVSYNDQNLDSALQAWLTTSSSTIQNEQQYSMNAAYDSGFSLQTKYALLALQGVRDGLMVDVACDDFSTPPASQTSTILGSTTPTRVPMTQAASLSMLATVVSQARLYPDSVDYDTQTFRTEVYPQSGKVSVNGQSVYLPLTYARMIQRCTFYNTPAVSGSPKGRPNSEVTMFTELNWIPSSNDQMQAFWAAAGNCAVYADRDTLYLSDIRTVYPDLTSLFSDGVYKDYICFTKSLIHKRWTYYEGLNLPAKKITSQLANDITNDCQAAMGSYMPTKTTVSVDDSNTASGYTLQANTDCYGYMPARILQSVITALRADTGTTSGTSSSTTSS